MNACILIDGRPAQGRPRGMGAYVQRLVAALALLPDAPRLKVALDKTAGEAPWTGLREVEYVWGQAGNPIAWEQQVLPKLAAGCGASLLHCTANTSPLSSSVPYVVTIHDTIFLRSLSKVADRVTFRQWVAHYYYRYGVGRGARRARVVLTVSEHSRCELIAKLRLPEAKVKSIPSAEPYPVQALPEEELQQVLAELQVERPYVLGLGAIDTRKNTANLVRAFARLPRSVVGRLVLAGFEKVEQTRIPALVEELGIKLRVKILGYLPQRQLTALFQGAAVFAYPSLAEGFGLPILQAFALGVPVVTSQSGALTEVAGPGARFADPRDPRSISHELMIALTDPTESHRMAYAGYLQAKRFNWEATAHKTLDVYRAALKNAV